MARTKSSSFLFGSLFGRRKRRRSAKKGWGFRRLFVLFLALITGSGSLVGASEFDVILATWKVLRDRVLPHIKPQPETAPSAGDIEAGLVRVYFTKPEQALRGPGDPAKALAAYVDKVEQTLDVAAFELDNTVIVDALVRATKRGVRVRLVTETNYINESGVVALKAVGVPVVDDKRDGALMHNKFMVFDRKAVWTGSMNFTENCAYKNNNNGIYILDTKLAENYATKFAWMFEQRKFGAAPSRFDRIPNAVITMADGVQVENFFSTHDRPAYRVIENLKMARRSIHFLAFSFTHDGIGQVMLDRSRSGVEVSGVFEKAGTATGHTEFNRMKQAGLAVFLDANPRNMHHKVIVIDGEVVITGSFNFSENADRSNDENVVVIYDRAVAAKYEEEFQKLHKLARDAAGR